ncbi:helix-turn-helix domain-containing protein [Streptomyces sp. NPDC013012]|uniref:helix-turn-helix domain-containing protein n=1 Tax=Streptomyces sp. NPDC013012 TaxID=3364860 RepID=UPI0036B16335
MSEQPEESYEEEEQSSALNRAIRKQLKLLRERAGLTQRELGDRLGYSGDLISSWRRGDGRRSGSSWRRRTSCWGPVGC